MTESTIMLAKIIIPEINQWKEEIRFLTMGVVSAAS